MKKRMLQGLVLLMLCLLPAMAFADSYGMAVIDGRDSYKVHLREEASSDAESLGLFFTGTEVEMRSDPEGQWIKVRIDGASGYIHSSCLKTGRARENVQEAFWYGVISAKNYVNFRRGPSTEFNLVGRGRINAGEPVDILGETSEGWYHVRHGSDTGYVSKNLVNVISRETGWVKSTPAPRPTRPPVCNTKSPSYALPSLDTLFMKMPYHWSHSSGAGGWSTELYIEDDGSFTGYYHDSEGSIIYESSFSGRFANLKKLDAYSCRMTVVSLEIEGKVGAAYADKGILHITQEPAGLALGDTFVFYMPSTPLKNLTQEELSWLQGNRGSRLQDEYLCNQNSGRGFMPVISFGE